MDCSFPYLKRLLATVAFGIILTVQCFFLAAYPATYENDPNWYAVTNLFAPAAKLRWLFYVWYLYVICALIPNIITIFVRVEDRFNKEKFLSPNALKVVLSLTPPLLLLLLHTAEDSLLLSICQLAENKLSEGTETAIHFRVAVARNVIQIVFVNLVFLIMRAVVFFKYGKDESIFIAKNIMGIILSILDIYALCESHSTSFWSLCVSCFGLRRPH